MTDALAVRDDDPPIRSFALWGTGGIGKSQIALEYASRQVTTGLPIVLWITIEKETEVASAFNKAAQRLQLPGVLPSNTPDRNRDLVLEYLQKTAVKWLLIFDNVEDSTNLEPIWPKTGTGNIVVTCRSESRAEPLVDEVIEFPTFIKEEGGDFIVKVVGVKAATVADMNSALMLSDRLGGLALALELIWKQIKIRRKTIEQFLPYCNDNRQSLSKQPKQGIKNPYYEKDLDTVWDGYFNDLSPNDSRLALCDVPKSVRATIAEKLARVVYDVLLCDV